MVGIITRSNGECCKYTVYYAALTVYARNGGEEAEVELKKIKNTKV